jgi:hypothetical protein
VTRVLRGEFPTRVRIGVPLTLIATISERGDAAEAWSTLRPVAVGAEVTLVCSAAGFELRSDMQVKVVVPAAGDSDPVGFELVASTAAAIDGLAWRNVAGSWVPDWVHFFADVLSAERAPCPVGWFAGSPSRRDLTS